MNSVTGGGKKHNQTSYTSTFRISHDAKDNPPLSKIVNVRKMIDQPDKEKDSKLFIGSH